MDKHNYLLRMVCTTLVFGMAIFLLDPGTPEAQEQCKLVTISGQAFPDVSVRIEPQSLAVSKGDCVVWVNWARATEVKILFREGKKCQGVTKAATGFKFEENSGCYVTDSLPLGGTSSLRFMEEGTFDYEIEAHGAKYPVKGSIVVKK